MTPPLPHRKRPCDECPWRCDVPPGQFPACRYDALRVTAGTPGAEAWFDAPMFACHLSREGRDIVCAGWLAVVGIEHLGMRLAVAAGRLNASVLCPGGDWPPLFTTYDEMAQTQQEPPL